MDTQPRTSEPAWQTVELDSALLAKIKARMAYGRFGDFGEVQSIRKARTKTKPEVSEASYQLTSNSGNPVVPNRA